MKNVKFLKITKTIFRSVQSRLKVFENYVKSSWKVFCESFIETRFWKRRIVTDLLNSQILDSTLTTNLVQLNRNNTNLEILQNREWMHSRFRMKIHKNSKPCGTARTKTKSIKQLNIVYLAHFERETRFLVFVNVYS